MRTDPNADKIYSDRQWTRASLQRDFDVGESCIVNDFANQILTRGYCVDDDGHHVRLHSHTSLEQCSFLASLARQAGCGDSLEVGLAFGLSALYLAEQAAQRGKRHIIIDPYQHDRVWRGVGLINLERAGLLPFCTFIEKDARTALPQLLQDGQRLTFAYIDAGKRLDDILIMFYFLFQMLELGGIIAFDDVAWFPGILDAVHYISRMPGVEVCGRFGQVRPTLRRRAMSWATAYLPVRQRLLSSEWAESAKDIRAGCIALKKISEDLGDWAWHPF